MKPEQFLDGRVALYHGDSREVLRCIPDASIDSVVTDPPYALVSIVKRFGGANAAPAKGNEAYARASAGFMGQTWDTGETAFASEFWAEVLRVLKPGGYVVAASGTRTYHRLAVAIEDAGFEIRDMVSWLYGSGFPKSHDVSKGIDKAAGAERVILRERPAYGIGGNGCLNGHSEGAMAKVTAPATDAAREWEGWGTALKPACEPWVLARKPLVGTVAANVLKHGTGALNIGACRIGDEVRTAAFTSLAPCHGNKLGQADTAVARRGTQGEPKDYVGRWPANVIHDGSEEVTRLFPDAGGGFGKRGGQRDSEYGFGGTMQTVGYGDEGSAARFFYEVKPDGARAFYSAKADADDRLGSKHPTVKPVDLMQYLVRLITPKGGVTLDPFAGTGTTGEAAWREGMSAILIEREAAYANDIRRRLTLAASGPDERKRESLKANGKAQTHDDLPLFGGE